MSDAEAASGIADDSECVPAPALTPEGIEAILADFRTWLTALTTQDHPAEAGTDSPEPVDLFTLVGQFTALRHEVNMQTKAARTAVEQNAEALKQLASFEPADPTEELRPIVKGIIDITDALALSLRQLEKFGDTAEPLLNDAEPDEVAAPPRGFFARLFGSNPAPIPAEVPPNPALEKLRQLVAAAADGYTLSLRRVERLLPILEIEPQSCVGEAFDPETMEAIEVVGASDAPPGTVLEEVRRGYLWRGKIFRFAQVKVAR
jgi:molecular chaperone GrpE